MWFEEENKEHTCMDCRYGMREISDKHCDKCIGLLIEKGESYTQWEEEISKEELLQEFMYAIGVW